MVTAEVKDGKPEKEQEYPCLKISEGNETIVLFEHPGKGSVVAQGSGDHQVGYSSKTWYMENFTPFTGSVTLRNG